MVHVVEVWLFRSSCSSISFLLHFALGADSRLHRFVGFPREDGWKPAGLNCCFIFAHGSQLPWAIADGSLGEALSGCCGCFLASEVWHKGTQWCGVMLPCEGLEVQFIWSWWGACLAITTLGQSTRVLGSAAGLYFVPWSCLLSSSYEAEWRPQGFVVWHPCGS